MLRDPLPRLYPGCLTDVADLWVGHAELNGRASGCTVVLCPQGAVCGVDVRGAAPGTRETDLLRPDRLVDRVHAVLLSGGSAFGLDAAGGVMRWLEERGHGFAVGDVHVPIVPAAVLYDLWVGNPRLRPDADTGYAACAAATRQPAAQGSVGAGRGASVGKLFGTPYAMKGGVGCAALTRGGITVAALIAVNAVGDIVDPADGTLVAGARDAHGALRDTVRCLLADEAPVRAQPGAATTIGVIATDAQLDKAQATALASMAHDGLARSIRPVHTQLDGDTLFVLATGGAQVGVAPGFDLSVLGVMAADVTAQAVLNGVRAARGLQDPPLPGLADPPR